MKTALVCAVQAPFVVGGAEILAAELRDQLARRGYRVDLVNVPFRWNPVAEIPRQALAFRLLDVEESNGVPVDLVIPTKFPSYLVRHTRKVAWLFHQHREAYDLWGSEYCSFRDTPEDREVRDAIRSMDARGLGECRRIYTISKNVATRLQTFNGLVGEALYPPPRHLGQYRCEEFGDFLLYAGRLDRLKRVSLLVDAMKRATSSARLVIAGEGPLGPELEKQVEGLGLRERVKLVGFVSTGELLDLYGRCRAALYAPVNEDYGYVTVEAFLSGKPVVTTTDAGGVLEFVSDGESGLVAEPTPQGIADAIDRLWSCRSERVREMGEAGRGRVVDITWDRVIDVLTSEVS